MAKLELKMLTLYRDAMNLIINCAIIRHTIKKIKNILISMLCAWIKLLISAS